MPAPTYEVLNALSVATYFVAANNGNTGASSASPLTLTFDISSVGGLGLGQQLANNCVPVVLTAAQLSTLTPLSSVAVTIAAALATNADGSLSGGAAGSKSLALGGIYLTSAPTLTNGQQCAGMLDVNGNLKVNVVTGGGSGSNAAASATAAAVPASADYAGLNIGGTLRGRSGVNVTGVVYAAHTDMTSVGGVALTLGQAAAGSCIPVVLPAGTAFGLTATTSGGWTPTTYVSTASTNATLVKNAAGQINKVRCTNTNTTAARVVRFFNKATAPVPGTDTPVIQIIVPAAISATQPTIVNEYYDRTQFTTGIGFDITGALGALDSTVVAAGDVYLDLSSN